MESENLIRMANRIADFFEAMPDRDEALEGIASHLKKFWAPSMRRQFLAQADANAPDLHEMVRVAVDRHRNLIA